VKILIAYASLTGASEDVAKYIAKKFENPKIVNLSTVKNIPDFNKYDKIILGSGIYFGKIHKDLKKVIEQNKELLLNKKFAFFFSCGSTDPKKHKEVIEKNYSSELKRKAMAISCVGGILNYKKCKFPAKIMPYLNLKMLKMKKQNPPELDYKKMDEFCEKINNITLNKPSKNTKNQNGSKTKTKKVKQTEQNKAKQTEQNKAKQTEQNENKIEQNKQSKTKQSGK